MKSKEIEFIATTGLGMQDLLLAEIQELGAANSKVQGTSVFFKGPLEIAYRVCLWSRIANRVLLPLKTFPAPTPEKLYSGVRSIHWSDHLTAKDTLAVDFSCSKSKITHSHYGALKVKDAVVDQFRSIEGVRPSVDPVRPNVRINVYVYEDVATVSIDLSGDSLHKRGYRAPHMPAALKENLAAALLRQAGWPRQGYAFLDPMCGSGTLVIEAAMMAAKIAPGLNREYYGFLGWQGHIPSVWSRLLKEADEVQIRDKKALPKIVGYDSDFRAVRVGLETLERAGLRGKVHFEKRDLTQCERIAEQGIFLTNPPYGERLRPGEDLRPLYKEIGDQMKKKFKGWEGYVFTGSSDLAKVIGLKASRRIPFFNGPIECRLLKYDLY